MSKPKTGKAIMTDEEIIKEYDECHIAIEEVIKIAREQGRADAEKERPKHFHIDYKARCEKILNEYEQQTKAMAIVKKQAYEKGRADVISQLSGEKKITVEVLNEAKRQGGEKAVADFKAKLLNYSKGNVVYGYSMKSRQIISDAIKEAEKK
jgi:hypothetical protein